VIEDLSMFSKITDTAQTQHRHSTDTAQTQHRHRIIFFIYILYLNYEKGLELEKEG
jgi:hypothetical protein